MHLQGQRGGAALRLSFHPTSGNGPGRHCHSRLPRRHCGVLGGMERGRWKDWDTTTGAALRTPGSQVRSREPSGKSPGRQCPGYLLIPTRPHHTHSVGESASRGALSQRPSRGHQRSWRCLLQLVPEPEEGVPFSEATETEGGANPRTNVQ